MSHGYQRYDAYNEARVDGSGEWNCYDYSTTSRRNSQSGGDMQIPHTSDRVSYQGSWNKGPPRNQEVEYFHDYNSESRPDHTVQSPPIRSYNVTTQPQQNQYMDYDHGASQNYVDNRHMGLSEVRSESVSTIEPVHPHVHESHDPRGHDLRGHGPRGHDPRGHDPRAHDPRSHDPRSHDPRSHDPRSHDPRSHDPRGHDPRSHDPRGHDPRGHNPHGPDPRTLDSRRHASRGPDPRDLLAHQPATGDMPGNRYRVYSPHERLDSMSYSQEARHSNVPHSREHYIENQKPEGIHQDLRQHETHHPRNYGHYRPIQGQTSGHGVQRVEYPVSERIPPKKDHSFDDYRPPRSSESWATLPSHAGTEQMYPHKDSRHVQASQMQQGYSSRNVEQPGFSSHMPRIRASSHSVDHSRREDDGYRGDSYQQQAHRDQFYQGYPSQNPAPQSRYISQQRPEIAMREAPLHQPAQPYHRTEPPPAPKRPPMSEQTAIRPVYHDNMMRHSASRSDQDERPTMGHSAPYAHSHPTPSHPTPSHSVPSHPAPSHHRMPNSGPSATAQIPPLPVPQREYSASLVEQQNRDKSEMMNKMRKEWFDKILAAAVQFKSAQIQFIRGQAPRSKDIESLTKAIGVLEGKIAKRFLTKQLDGQPSSYGLYQNAMAKQESMLNLRFRYFSEMKELASTGLAIVNRLIQSFTPEHLKDPKAESHYRSLSSIKKCLEKPYEMPQIENPMSRVEKTRNYLGNLIRNQELRRKAQKQHEKEEAIKRENHLKRPYPGNASCSSVPPVSSNEILGVKNQVVEAKEPRTEIDLVQPQKRANIVSSIVNQRNSVGVSSENDQQATAKDDVLVHSTQRCKSNDMERHITSSEALQEAPKARTRLESVEFSQKSATVDNIDCKVEKDGIAIKDPANHDKRGTEAIVKIDLASELGSTSEMTTARQSESKVKVEPPSANTSQVSESPNPSLVEFSEKETPESSQIKKTTLSVEVTAPYKAVDSPSSVFDANIPTPGNSETQTTSPDAMVNRAIHPIPVRLKVDLGPSVVSSLKSCSAEHSPISGIRSCFHAAKNFTTWFP